VSTMRVGVTGTKALIESADAAGAPPASTAIVVATRTVRSALKRSCGNELRLPSELDRLWMPPFIHLDGSDCEH